MELAVAAWNDATRPAAWYYVSEVGQPEIEGLYVAAWEYATAKTSTVQAEWDGKHWRSYQSGGHVIIRPYAYRALPKTPERR